MELYIMEALALFQYLTSAQLISILPPTSLSTVNRHLRALKNADTPMIRSLNFGFAPWKWSLAPVYCLTDRWAKLLARQQKYSLSSIQRPLGRSCFFATDYFHRMATIDFKISFLKYLAREKYSLNFFHCYFEREGSNNSHTGIMSKSKTALQESELQIIPDAIVGYTSPEWSHLVIFEQHMGTDSKRAITQIKWHCWFLSRWVVNAKYGSQKNSLICYVFEKKSCMESVIHRLKQVSWFTSFQPYFRFKTMEESLASLFTG